MTAAKRNITVDVARSIAAFGVIAIHVTASTRAAAGIGLFFSPLCVPFFFIVSLTYFVAGLNKNKPTRQILKKSWYRIIVPYLAWTIIYLLFMVVKGKLTGTQHVINLRFLLEGFFYGASTLHLYFLPQLFALQCIALGLYLLRVSPNNKKVNGAILLLFAIIYIIVGNVYHVYGVTDTSCLLFYIIAAFYFSNKTIGTTLNAVYIIAGIMITAIAAVSLFFPINNFYLNYFCHLPIGGLGVLLISIGAPKLSSSNLLILVCSTSYGVYLNHVVFVEGFQFLFKKFHIVLYYDFFWKIFMAVIIFICAVVLTLILRRNKITKKLFLGE